MKQILEKKGAGDQNKAWMQAKKMKLRTRESCVEDAVCATVLK
jgi:hypothetical protein